MFTADGSSAHVTNANDDTVSVIDTRSRRVIRTIALGSGTTTDSVTSFTQLNHVPTAAELGPDGKHLGGVQRVELAGRDRRARWS